MKDFDPDDLSAKLRTWQVGPQVPGSFQREVWQRIAARQTAREEAFWPQLVQWVSSQFVRPRYALALVAVALSVSLGAAHLQAQDANARLGKQLAARYATSVDPLAMMAR